MKKKSIVGAISSILAAAFFIACAQSPFSTESDFNLAKPAPIASDPHACENIFYPLAVNNQWNYILGLENQEFEGRELDQQSSALSLTIKEVAESSAILSIVNSASGIEMLSPVQCRDGAIIDFPLTELNMLTGMLSGNLDLQYVSGTFMPSREDFEGHDWKMEWETEYSANGSLEGMYEGETLTAELSSSPLRMQWKVISTSQSLEVPAGKFDNLVRINRKTSIDVSYLRTNIEDSEVNLSTTLTLDTDLWYAPDLGLVKQQINSVYLKFYGINFPVDIKGAIELQSFTIH